MRIVPHEALLADPPARERNQFGLVSRCCGIVMVISRGLGCTKLASANMAPYAAPPNRPTTTRRRIRLGIVATRQRPLWGMPAAGLYEPDIPATRGSPLTITFRHNWQGRRGRGISLRKITRMAPAWRPAEPEPDGRACHARCG